MENSIFLIYNVLSLSLAITYIAIIANYIKGWKQLKKWNIPENYQPQTKVSILIPARNEAENILLCLNSILTQDFPKELLQIIIIDDHSTDNTAFLVRSIPSSNILLISLADYITNPDNQSFKKQAITVGIENATGDLIVTTDADCLVPTDWLNLIVSYYEKNKPVFIAAPVNFHRENNILERFQSLDFMGMMAVTGAGIQQGWMNMCNGANLAYPKAIFNDVNGFEGINHLASGDDMLLMQKIAQKHPNQIGFIKNKAATVVTEAKPTIRSFINQRVRWASKSTAYPEWKVTFILALVFFFCSNILFSSILAIFWKWELFYLVCVQIIAKAFADFIFLKKMSTFFDRRDLMRFFAPAFFLHTAYIIVIGVLGNLVKTYEWKGRQVS